MVDEAHGAGVLGARGAGTAELLGVEDRSTCGWATFSKSLASLRRLHRRPGRGRRLPARSSRAPSSSPPRRVPAAVGAALAALRIVPLRRGPAAARRGARQRPLPARRPRASAASRSSSPQRCRTARDVVTPIVPVLVGDDWKAGAAVEGALRRRRVRQHRPAPGRPARRRAAAHERHGDPRPRRRSTARSTPSPPSRRAFEAEHGPLPGPARRLTCRPVVPRLVA